MQVKQVGKEVRVLSDGVIVTIRCKTEAGASMMLYNFYREVTDCATEPADKGGEDGRE